MTDTIDPNKALKDKVAALRAKTTLSPEEAEARQLRAEIEDLETKERDLLLERLEDEHTAAHPGSEVEGVDVPHVGIFVVRNPAAASWNDYRVKCEKKTVTATDEKNLVLGCLLHPDADKAQALFNDFPATVTTLGNVVAELAGLKMKERDKRGRRASR
jgi:hypothetical protein